MFDECLPDGLCWSVAPLVPDELAIALHRRLSTLRALFVIAGWIVQLAFDGATMAARSSGGNVWMERPLLAEGNTQILAV